jgi:hypothetical protein
MGHFVVPANKENVQRSELRFEPCTPLQTLFLQGECTSTLCPPLSYGPGPDLSRSLLDSVNMHLKQKKIADFEIQRACCAIRWSETCSLVAKSRGGTAEAPVLGTWGLDQSLGSELECGWVEFWSEAHAPAQVSARVPSSRPKLSSEGQEPLRLSRDLCLTLGVLKQYQRNKLALAQPVHK